MTMKTQDLLTVATKVVARNLLFRLRMDKALTEKCYIKEGAVIEVRNNLGSPSRPTPYTINTTEEMKVADNNFRGPLWSTQYVTKVELSTLSTERLLNPLKSPNSNERPVPLKDPILRIKVTFNTGTEHRFSMNMSTLEELVTNPNAQDDSIVRLTEMLPENSSLLSLTMKGQMMIRIQDLLSNSKIFLGVPAEPYKEYDRMRKLEKVRNVIREVEYDSELLVGIQPLLERDIQQHVLYENVMFMLNLPIALRKVSDSKFFTVETRIPYLVRAQISRGGTKVTMNINHTPVASINAYNITGDNCLQIINNHYERIYTTHMSIDTFKDILVRNIENEKFAFRKEIEFNCRLRNRQINDDADYILLKSSDMLIDTIKNGVKKDSK